MFCHRRIANRLFLQDKCGFTLLEVMIVVVIIGITSALAIPNYRQWNAQYQMKQEMVTLFTNLNLARMLAINRNMAVTVTLGNGVTDPEDGVQKVTASFSPAIIPAQRMAKAGVLTLANTTPSGSLPIRTGYQTD